MGKKIIINSETLENRVALLKNELLEEYQIERANCKNIAGSLYLGRITNHEPTLQAAFVDIGEPKNAFLHYWDMLPASYDMVEEFQKEEANPEPKKKRTGISARIKNFFSSKEVDIFEELS